MKAFIVLAAVLACAFAKPGLVYNNVVGYPWTTGVHTYAAGAPAVTYSSAPTWTYASAPAVTYTAAVAPAVHHTAVVTPVATKTQYHAQDELGQASYGYSHPGQAHAALRDAAGNVKGSYAYVDPTGKQVRVDYVADHNGYRAESNALPQGPVANLVAPVSVQDTPEVVAARAAHLRAVHEVKSRQRRSPLTLATYPWGTHHAYTTYNTAPITTYSHAAPITTYSTAPITTYAAASPVTHYTSAVVSHPVREATLTTVHNNPGHAVSYRVD